MKENKTKEIHIRLTEEEKGQLKKIAYSAGYTLSAYIKKAVLKNRIVSKTDIQTVYELKKIGVNINQIAKFINTFPVEDNVPYAIKTLDLYIQKLETLIKHLYDN
jgi:hypothetical protein